jgi:hypothetical protein
MTSVITATTDVVISLKSNAALRRLELSGTDISRISVMRITPALVAVILAACHGSMPDRRHPLRKL